jgi:hypothetical protein
MKKLAAILAGAVIMAGFGTMAHAVPVPYTPLEMMLNGETPLQDISPSDPYGIPGGYITSSAKIGNWAGTTTGTSYRYSGAAEYPDMNLSGTSLKGSGTLTILLTDTNFNPRNEILNENISGSIGKYGSVTFAAFYNTSDTPFAITPSSKTVQLFSFSSGTLNGNVNSFNYNGSSLLQGLTAPFSLTEEIILSFSADHSGNASYTSNLTAVTPEPGTMMLFGIGMLTLVIFGKRRMNKEA